MATFTIDIYDQELDRVFRDNKAYISDQIRSKEYEVMLGLGLDRKPLKVYGMRYILKTKEEINNERYKGATYEDVIRSIIGRIGKEYTVEKNGDDYIIKPLNDMVRESKLKNFAIVQGRAKQKAYEDQLREKQRRLRAERKAEEERRRPANIANKVIEHQRKPWRGRQQKRGKGRRRKRWTSPKQRLFEELKF